MASPFQLTLPAPDWVPFWVDNQLKIPPRALNTRDGVGDRLRTAAFAEVQAERGFLWAAETLLDAPEALRDAWKKLAGEERKHRGWLVVRMDELGIQIQERPVSDTLWLSLIQCQDAQEFAHRMAGAEERGRRAGERFGEQLKQFDPSTAAIFAQIALEEQSHIDLAHQYYPLFSFPHE